MPPQHAYTLGMYYRDSAYTHELSLSLAHMFIHLRCAQRGVLLHASVRPRRRRAPLPVPFADDNGGEPPRTLRAFAYTRVRQRRRSRYPECSAASPTFTNVADQKRRALTAVPASVYATVTSTMRHRTEGRTGGFIISRYSARKFDQSTER